MKRIVAVILTLAMGIASLAVLTSCGKQEPKAPEGTVTRMQVDINPSIELMVDDENKVVSVTALNDDGSVLIAGEAFVGLTAEEAVELVVSLATETGYIVRGSVSAGENEVKISVSGHSEYAKKLKENAQKKAEDFLKESGITATVTVVEGMKMEALRALASETSGVTEEEIAAMSENDLYKVIAAGRIETALLLTDEMREAYYTARDYEISFAEREETAEIIRGLGTLYETTYNTYKELLDRYRAAIRTVEEARYDNLVSPDSEYQKALTRLRESKAELLKGKKLVASVGTDDENYLTFTAQLRLSEENYERALATVEALGEAANRAFDTAIAAMKSVEALLAAQEEKFMSNEVFTQQLTNRAQEIETAINTAKRDAFAAFENAHKEDINNTLATLQERKNALIDEAKK